MFCHQCGANNRDEATFCKKCGSKLVRAQDGKEHAETSQNSSKLARSSEVGENIIDTPATVKNVSDNLFVKGKRSLKKNKLSKNKSHNPVWKFVIAGALVLIVLAILTPVAYAYYKYNKATNIANGQFVSGKYSDALTTLQAVNQHWLYKTYKAKLNGSIANYRDVIKDDADFQQAKQDEQNSDLDNAKKILTDLGVKNNYPKLSNVVQELGKVNDAIAVKAQADAAAQIAAAQKQAQDAAALAKKAAANEASAKAAAQKAKNAAAAAQAAANAAAAKKAEAVAPQQPSASCSDNNCRQNYGYYSVYSYYDSTQNKCICDCQSGYVFNKSGTECISYNAECAQDYQNSYWNGTLGSNGGPICSCDSGYSWNSDDTACFAGCPSGECMLNSSCVLAPLNSHCNMYSSTGWLCDTGDYQVGSSCFTFSTLDSACKSKDGYGGYFTGTIDSNGKYICDCSSGYYWSGSYCLISY